MPLHSVLGTQARLWYGAYDLSDFIASIDAPDSLNPLDVTTLTSTAVTEEPGAAQGGFSASGFLDVTADTGSEAILQAAFAARAQRPLTIPLGGNTLGAVALLGLTQWGTLDRAIALGELETLDMEWGTREGSFGGYVLHALAAVSGAGTTYSPPVDFGAALTAYAATLHVPAASGSGSPSLTVTVQSSATQGGTYVDEFSFTVVAGTTPTSEYVSATGAALDRWVRCKIDLAGTAPAYTFGAALAARA